MEEQQDIPTTTGRYWWKYGRWVCSNVVG